MARKSVFTEAQVIEAVAQLNKQGKKINGTNLRLEVGVGSPKKLLETYNNLLAKGKVKDISHSEIEALELQLEISLEELSRVEEELSFTKNVNNLLIQLFIESCNHHYHYASGGTNPYSNIYETFIDQVNSLEINYLNKEVSLLRSFIIENERRFSEQENKIYFSNKDSELYELHMLLSDVVAKRKLESPDLEPSIEELGLIERIDQLSNEQSKSSLIQDIIEKYK